MLGGRVKLFNVRNLSELCATNNRVSLCGVLSTRSYSSKNNNNNNKNNNNTNKLVVVGLGNIGKQFEGTRHNIGFTCVDAIASKYNLSFQPTKHHALVAEGMIECNVEVKQREEKEKKKKDDKNNKNNNTKEETDKDKNKENEDKEKEKEEKEEKTKQIIPPVPRPPPVYMKVMKHLILVKPTTFMNKSGQAVSSIITSYQVPLSCMLVITDDLDLDAGRVQLKKGGGTTQKGIVDIVKMLKTQDFLRARFGISQPSHASMKAEFVLKSFSRQEMERVREGIARVCEGVKVWLEKGEVHAMNTINMRK